MLRFGILFTLLVGFSGLLLAQNYYVAVVSGEVYHNDRPLKKRKKIKLGGNLRFSGPDDYVKLSGPGGLHTLSASQGESAGNEFLLALRQELLPQVSMRPTIASNLGDISQITGTVGLWGLLGKDYHFFEGQELSLNEPWKLAGKNQLYLLRQTADGLSVLAISPEDETTIELTEEVFSVTNGPGQTEPAVATAFVRTADPATARRLAKDFDTVTALLTHRESQEEADFTILDYVGRVDYLDRRKFRRDLRWLIRKTRPGSTSEMLHDFYFDEYIANQYGEHIYGLYSRLEELL